MARIRKKNLSQLNGIEIKDTTGPAELEAGTSAEKINGRFPGFPYVGYHRTTIGDYLNGGGQSPYSRQQHGGTEADQEGLYWYNQHIQRLEMLIQSTGEPAVLLRRKWTGELCTCYDGNRGQGRNKCPLCVVPGTRILMADYTFKKIENIQVGDKVFTHKGQKRLVTKIFQSSISEEINTIETQHGLQLSITDEHPMFRLENLKCRYKKDQLCKPGRCWICKQHLGCKGFVDGAFVESKQIQIGQYLAGIVLPISPTTIKWSNELVRLSGYYLSEGSLNEYQSSKYATSKRIVFTLHINELETLGAEIKSLVKEVYGKNCWVSKNVETNSCQLGFQSMEAFNFFYENFGKGAKEKVLSSQVFGLSNEQLKELLSTYILGDGWQSKRGMVRFYTASETLAEQLRLILYRLGIVACIAKLKRKSYFKKYDRHYSTIIYEGMINGSDICKLQETLKTKQARKRQANSNFVIGDYVAYPVRKITRTLYTGTVYNIEVEEDNSYIANGLAVHNCYGTGIVGGYVRYINCREPQGRIWMRVGPTNEDLDLQEDGLRQKFVSDNWTLPTPIIRDRDVIVLFDPETGEETWRYEVLAVDRNRGMFRRFVAQKFNMHQFEKTDPIYNIEVFGTAYNAVGDLSGGIEPSYDPHPGYGYTDPSTGYGDAYNDRGFSEGYIAGYEKGYQTAIDNGDFDPSLDSDFYGTIQSPYGADDPQYDDAGKQNYMYGWEQGYRDGWVKGGKSL